MAKLKTVWDLDRDGITQGFLAKFLVCPERARLNYVEGLTESGLRAGLEFGSAFHRCLEHPDSDPREQTTTYMQNRSTRNIPTGQVEEFERLMGMVEVTADAYKRYWSQDRQNIDWVVLEQAFEVPYTFQFVHPTGRKLVSKTVKLRGRWDGVFRSAQDGNRLWLFETKTKSDIDVLGLQGTLAQDLQTMFYATTVEQTYNEKVAGVLYNVIRRPGLRISESRRETLPAFLARVREDINRRPQHYFHRWEVSLEDGDLQAWQTKTLNPLLTKATLWWESIKGNPFNPWSSPYHYQRPFGVFDSLASGRRGDYYELLTSGSTHGLYPRDEPFPELEGDAE